ncbi:MAG: M20/M25/M40 family metallo-hydrolase [Planctomycetota bacterium]
MFMRHTARLSTALAVITLAVGCRTAPPAPATQRAGLAITARAMRAHVDFLASDALAGREAGQPSGDVAAEYIAAQFARLGLRPVAEDWGMEFALRGGAGRATAELVIGRERLAGLSLVTAPPCSAAGERKGRVVERDADSCAGAFVLTADVPRGRERRAAEGLFAQGAAGVILVSERAWLTVRSGGRRAAARSQPAASQAAPESAPAGSFSRRAGAEAGEMRGSPNAGGERTSGPLPGPVVRVCTAVGERLREAAQAQEEITIQVSRAGRDRSFNVLALVPGCDPQLKDEYVVVGGHYDHVGVSSRGEVYNGADDNASGTAAVLGIAEALTHMPPPKRSILLVAWGAEEKGLVGSFAFGGQPPVPLESIVAYVNMDMVGRNDPNEIETGHASDTLAAWADEAARANGLTPKPITAGFLLASDTAVFVRHEIPTVFYHSGLHPQLHRPEDDAELIDADKVARVARAALELVWRVAHAPQRPAFSLSTPTPDGVLQIELGASDGRRELRIRAAPGRAAAPVEVSGPGE